MTDMPKALLKDNFAFSVSLKGIWCFRKMKTWQGGRKQTAQIVRQTSQGQRKKGNSNWVTLRQSEMAKSGMQRQSYPQTAPWGQAITHFSAGSRRPKQQVTWSSKTDRISDITVQGTMSHLRQKMKKWLYHRPKSCSQLINVRGGETPRCQHRQSTPVAS